MAQEIILTKQDSTIKLDSSGVLLDSIPTQADSILSHVAIDSLQDSTNVTYDLSKDALDTEVTYEAQDSSWTDLINEKIHLYGNAKVNYQKIKLTSDYMIINFSGNLIEGFAVKDTAKRKQIKPEFSDGEKTFSYQEIKYNFKSKKGLVKHAITKEGEFTLVGSTTKYISGITDSLNNKTDDEIYNHNAVITTCDHDPPHFGIRANKLKFVPNKLAVLSVAQIELGGVPTPIFLPFGFFPLAKGKSSGILFPSYDYSDANGFTFRGLGYYYPINNNIDMRLTTDISTRGSILLRTDANYKKRYGYSGQATLEYRNNVSDNLETGGKSSSRSYSLNVTHRQDPKAHPYRTLGGSINIQSNGHNQSAYNNAKSVLTNQYSSNFNFTHSMPGTPFQFTASFNHSQNITTRVMDITLPNMTLRMNTIYPFKKKNSTEEKWSDNIALSYGSEFRNFVKTTDTTLFTSQTLKDIQTGLKQNASISTNIRLFKYINVSPSASIDEYFLLKQYTKTFQGIPVIDTISRRDTLSFEAPTDSFTSGFTNFTNFNASISLNTQIYGTKKFSKGFIRGFRHVMKPNLSFNYHPDNKTQYDRMVDTDTRADYNNPLTYSILSNGAFPISGSEKQMSIGYGLNNVFEAKYRSKKDSIDKKIKLFQNINVNGFYNIAADSFNWSPISITGTTTVLKGLTNFNFSAVFSPYVYDSKNKITQELVWDNRKKLAEFRTFNGQFSTSLSFNQIREIFTGKKDAKSVDAVKSDKSEAAKTQPIESSLADWFSNFNISHSLNFRSQKMNGKDSLFISNHSISLNGSIPLSKNWNFGISNISYDFKNKAFPYPDFTFGRDLHCWNLNITWAPARNYYSFFIGVKSSALNFIKYNYNQGFSSSR